MANAKTRSEGELRAYFDTPADPLSVRILYDLPFTARVTSVVVRYTNISHEQALAELQKEISARKRHDAAVKANATRKAKKGGEKGGEA